MTASAVPAAPVASTHAAAPPATSPAAAPVLAPLLLLALIAALQFGPLVGLLGFRLTGDPVWALSGALRDGLVLALLGLAVQARLTAGQSWPVWSSVRWALLFVGIAAVTALLSASALLVTALNLRRMVLVPCLFLAILWLPWQPAQIDRLFRALVTSAMVVVLFGLFERVAPDSLWTDWLQVETYTAANGFDKFGTVPFDSSGRFFTWDLVWLTGEPSRRMVSTYIEPTTLAACMAALLCFALARQARGHRSALLVTAALAGGVLTLSKGFLLFVPLFGLWLALGASLVGFLVFLVVVISALATALAAGSDLTGAFLHVDGLASGIGHLLAGNWFGEGLGVAGGLSNDHVEAGHESGFGTLLAQVGIVAFLHLAWVLALARDLTQAGRRTRDPGARYLGGWLVFWMVTYLLSSSSLGVGGNAIGFIGLALYLRSTQPEDLRASC